MDQTLQSERDWQNTFLREKVLSHIMLVHSGNPRSQGLGYEDDTGGQPELHSKSFKQTDSVQVVHGR